jgi:hypothetical protein
MLVGMWMIGEAIFASNGNRVCEMYL